MAENYPSNNWWLFLFVLVVILCVLGLFKAVDQRDSRMEWMNKIERHLQTNDGFQNVLSNNVDEILNRENSYATKTMLQNAISSINVTPATTTNNNYRHVAGCYGVVPKDNRWFNLTCDKEFSS